MNEVVKDLAAETTSTALQRIDKSQPGCRRLSSETVAYLYNQHEQFVLERSEKLSNGARAWGVEGEVLAQETWRRVIRWERDVWPAKCSVKVWRRILASIVRKALCTHIAKRKTVNMSEHEYALRNALRQRCESKRGEEIALFVKEKLPRRERDVFMLSKIGFAQQDIAKELCLSLTTVKRCYIRVKKAIRKEFMDQILSGA